MLDTLLRVCRRYPTFLLLVKHNVSSYPIYGVQLFSDAVLKFGDEVGYRWRYMLTKTQQQKIV